MAVEYEKVWDKNGELFEVPHERAATLVLNEGWSKTAPLVVSDAPAAEAETVEQEEPNE